MCSTRMASFPAFYRNPTVRQRQRSPQGELWGPFATQCRNQCNPMIPLDVFRLFGDFGSVHKNTADRPEATQ
jgi:hypothetical protein